MSQNSWIPDWERIPKWRQHAVSRLPTETINSQFGRRRESDRSQNISSNALQRENQVAGGGEGRRCRNEKSHYPNRDHGWQSKRSKKSCNNRKRQQHRSYKRTCESSARNEVKESDLETTGERDRETERQRGKKNGQLDGGNCLTEKRGEPRACGKRSYQKQQQPKSFGLTRFQNLECTKSNRKILFVTRKKEEESKRVNNERQKKLSPSTTTPKGGQKRLPKSAGKNSPQDQKECFPVHTYLMRSRRKGRRNTNITRARTQNRATAAASAKHITRKKTWRA